MPERKKRGSYSRKIPPLTAVGSVGVKFRFEAAKKGLLLGLAMGHVTVARLGGGQLHSKGGTYYFSNRRQGQVANCAFLTGQAEDQRSTLSKVITMSRQRTYRWRHAGHAFANTSSCG
jgi:hypothetical protein